VEPHCGINQVAGSSLKSLCSKYADIFQEELGTMQGLKPSYTVNWILDQGFVDPAPFH